MIYFKNHNALKNYMARLDRTEAMQFIRTCNEANPPLYLCFREATFWTELQRDFPKTPLAAYLVTSAEDYYRPMDRFTRQILEMPNFDGPV